MPITAIVRNGVLTVSGSSLNDVTVDISGGVAEVRDGNTDVAVDTDSSHVVTLDGKSANADIFASGDQSGQQLNTGPGHDWFQLVHALAGVNGGSGSDTISLGAQYEYIDLAAGRAYWTTPSGSFTPIVSIENVEAADSFPVRTVIGTDAANRFDGGRIQNFYGHGGNDTIIAAPWFDNGVWDLGAGDDVLEIVEDGLQLHTDFYGGSGVDIIRFAEIHTGDSYNNGRGITILQSQDLSTGTYNYRNDLAFGELAGFEVISGTKDNDTITAPGSTVYGGHGDDVIEADVALGRWGVDALTGRRADGGTGNDILVMTSGSEFLDGGVEENGSQGIDLLRAGAGVVDIDLNAGTATYQGSSLVAQVVNIENLEGGGVLRGDDGANRITGLNTTDDILVGRSGDDVLLGKDGEDELLGQKGDDELFGELGNDIISGGDGHDLVNGSNGDDILYGGTGDDMVSGGLGFDMLFAGPGNNVLGGGSDADHFVFYAADKGSSRIVDFEPGSALTDVVELGGTSFTSFNDILDAGHNTRNGWFLRIDGDTAVTLAGVTEAELHSNDFMLI